MKKGFSLIELMVVICIVGILAVVAVPNFKRLQAKSSQVEAKNVLADYYQSATLFFNEYNSYSADWTMLGYNPAGSLHYRITTLGQGSPMSWPTGFSGIPGMYSGGSYFTCVDSVAGNCPAVPDSSNNNYKAKFTELSFGPVAPIAAPVSTANSFLAIATTQFPNVTGKDEWTIDHQQTLVNSTVGLP